MKRPTGVTILGWVGIVGGIFRIIGGVAITLIGFFAAALGTVGSVAGAGGDGAALAVTGMFTVVWAIWFAVIGIGEIIFGVGALGLKPWAWSLGLGLIVLGAISDVINLFINFRGVVGTLISLVIWVAVAYYLYTDEVRAAFGKTDKQPPSFLVPVFDAIDGMMSNRKGGTPQAPGGYQPPQAPGGYQPPAAPANYQAPAAPTMPPADIPAPPAPPAPPA